MSGYQKYLFSAFRVMFFLAEKPRRSFSAVNYGGDTGENIKLVGLSLIYSINCGK